VVRCFLHPAFWLKPGLRPRGFEGHRVLLVTDPGIRAAGHEERTIDYLQHAGMEVVVFDQVRENPTTKDVALAVEAAREEKSI